MNSKQKRFKVLVSWEDSEDVDRGGQDGVTVKAKTAEEAKEKAELKVMKNREADYADAQVAFLC